MSDSNAAPPEAILTLFRADRLAPVLRGILNQFDQAAMYGKTGKLVQMQRSFTQAREDLQDLLAEVAK